MYTLGINTATQVSSICLLKDGQILGERKWEVKSQETRFLIPSLQELLKEFCLDLKELGQIILIKGPGPFTGIRIGVVLANALAQNMGMPIYALSTFEYINLAMAKQDFDKILVNAGGEMVFVVDPKNLKDINIVNVSELKNLKVSVDLTPKQSSLLNESIELIPNLRSFAQVCSEFKFEDHLVEKLPCIPYYVKPAL